MLTKTDVSEVACKYFFPLRWTVKQYLCCRNFTYACHIHISP